MRPDVVRAVRMEQRRQELDPVAPDRELPLASAVELNALGRGVVVEAQTGAGGCRSETACSSGRAARNGSARTSSIEWIGASKLSLAR